MVGSSEIQSKDLSLAAQQANVLSTWPFYC